MSACSAGHSWQMIETGNGRPVRILCDECGLAGTVVWPCPTQRCIANDGHRGGHVLAD